MEVSTVPEFIVKKYYKYENSKIDLRFINLDNFYKKKINFLNQKSQIIFKIIVSIYNEIL